MSKWVPLVAPVLALAIVGAAYGQVQITSEGDRADTHAVRLSGEIDFNWAWSSDELQEVLGDDAGTSFIDGGRGAGAADNSASNFFWGHVTIRAVADLADNIQAVVEIGTRNRDDGTVNNFGDDSAGQGSLMVRKAYVDINEFLDPALRLRAGRQPAYSNLRDASRSGSFTFDVDEAGTPWAGVNTSSHNSRVDMSEPTGFRLTYSGEDWTFDLYLLPDVDVDATGTSDNFASNDQIYRAELNYRFMLGDSSDHSLFQAAISYLVGGTEGAAGGADPDGPGLANTTPGHLSGETGTWDFGLGLDLRDVAASGLELFGEVHFQGGEAGERPVAGTPNLDSEGWAFQVGLRYDHSEEGGVPWHVEAKYTFYSGDDNQTDSDNEAYLGYGNLGDLYILEHQVLGFGINTNMRSLKLSGGVTVDAWGRPLDLNAILAFNDADEDVPNDSTVAFPLGNGSGSDSDDFGTELDLEGVYHINSQVTFSTAVAWLWNADALDRFTRGTDDNAWLWNMGFNVKW